MITTIALVNTSIMSLNYLLCVCGENNEDLVSKFEVYTEVLTVIIMLYNRSSGLLFEGNLYC